MNKTLQFFVCIANRIFVGLALAGNVAAQDLDLNSVHWAYSSYFGTGWYTLGNERDAYVFRMTPRWSLRQPSIDDDGNRHIGIELRLPITAGLDTFVFENLSDTIDPDNLASISVTPGVDIQIPLSERWALRPFAAAGWGTLLNGSDSAWTYWGGVKSRYVLHDGRLNWALINSVALVAYSPGIGNSQKFWPLSGGFEFDYLLARHWIGEQRALLHWHALYTRFESNLDLVASSGRRRPIADQWEFGLSVGKQNGPIRIGWLHFDRLGLAYRFSSDGELKGINVVLRSLFEL